MQERNIVKIKGEDIIEDVYDALIDLMNILSVRNIFRVLICEY